MNTTMSNDGTGLRERLKLAANALDPPLSSEWRPFSDKATAALLREAATALSAVAPPPVLEDGVSADELARGLEGWAQIVIGETPRLLLQRSAKFIRNAASPAAPAQPEGGGGAAMALDTTLRVAHGLLAWVQSIAKGENDTFIRLGATFDLDERYAMAEALRHEAIDAIASLDPDGEGMGAEQPTRPAPAQQEWQSIETAPKDGRDVILSNGFWSFEATSHQNGTFTRTKDGLQTAQSNCRFWQPLPNPPALASNAATAAKAAEGAK